MTSKMISPYGSWESPITAELITKGGFEALIREQMGDTAN